jgi:hypothetical protein
MQKHQQMIAGAFAAVPVPGVFAPLLQPIKTQIRLQSGVQRTPSIRSFKKLLKCF